MSLYVTYRNWTNTLDIVNADKSEKNVVEISDELYDEMLQTPHTNYIVDKGKVILKDNIVRNNQENIFTEIPYGDYGLVRIQIFLNDALLKVQISTGLLQQYIDPYQFDKIQFLNPVLKIFLHSKKSPELLGTLEIDLDEYIKTGKYEQDISTVLSKVNIEDLVFKTRRCFKDYSYKIVENKTLKSIDRNLIDEDFHIIATYTNNTLKISHNIKYWQEFHYNHNTKIVLSFIDGKNKHALEHYVTFELWQLEKNNSISFDVPKSIATKKINVNVNWLKVKYENTSN